MENRREKGRNDRKEKEVEKIQKLIEMATKGGAQLKVDNIGTSEKLCLTPKIKHSLSRYNLRKMSTKALLSTHE